MNYFFPLLLAIYLPGGYCLSRRAPNPGRGPSQASFGADGDHTGLTRQKPVPPGPGYQLQHETCPWQMPGGSNRTSLTFSQQMDVGGGTMSTTPNLFCDDLSRWKLQEVCLAAGWGLAYSCLLHLGTLPVAVAGWLCLGLLRVACSYPFFPCSAFAYVASLSSGGKGEKTLLTHLYCFVMAGQV